MRIALRVKDFKNKLRENLVSNYNVPAGNALTLVEYGTGIYKDELDFLKDNISYTSEIIKTASEKLIKFHNENKA